MNILVTAGGTKEYIDDVRYITNLSSGKFGREFAVTAQRNGHRVTLLAPKEMPLLNGPLNEIEHIPFTSTQDLEQQLIRLSLIKQWDIVIHSAAVSDYRPKRSSGKISSDLETLTLEMERTPKLIRNMRQWFGHAFIVGFKLLSGASKEDRYRIALEQVKKNRTNLCIENDMSEIKAGLHKVRTVTPEGGSLDWVGDNKTNLAIDVFAFIQRRAKVNWYKTVYKPYIDRSIDLDEAAKYLDFCHKTHLLRDENGNASFRLDQGDHTFVARFAITPRAVDKSKLRPSDFIVAEAPYQTIKATPDPAQMFIWSSSETRKPSIDSSVSGNLYNHFPYLDGIIHTHSKWCITPVSTRMSYPCGVYEESVQVFEALKKHRDAPFLVELVNHGFLLGLGHSLTIDKLLAQYEEMVADWKEHMREIQRDPSTVNGILIPILSNEGIIGHVLEHTDKSVSPRLLNRVRGRGYGKKIIDILINNNLKVKTINECQVKDFYLSFGFKVLKETADEIILGA